MEKINCQICNSNKHVSVTKRGQFDIETNVVICTKCGFSYLNPRWSKEEYFKFYSDDYEKYYPRTSVDDKIDTLIFNLIHERLSKNNIASKNLKILDIGAGFGSILRKFKAHDDSNSLFAIEPSRSCIEFLQSENIEVVSNDVDDSWEKSNSKKFDLVVMRHVLEHFTNPLETMKKIKEVLSNEGIVYVAVPDFFHPKSPLNSYYFRVVHLSYFNKNSITNLMLLAGFKIIDFEDNLNGELYVIAKPSNNQSKVSFSSFVFIKQSYILIKQYLKEGINKKS